MNTNRIRALKTEYELIYNLDKFFRDTHRNEEHDFSDCERAQRGAGDSENAERSQQVKRLQRMPLV
jgi:hypothetical protein